MRESKKNKVERLEKNVLKNRLQIDKLQNELLVMRERANEEFLNSTIYREMAKKIKDLELENRRLQNINNVNTQKNVQNERGAGRKEKLSNQDKELIKMYRIQGFKINELAKMFKCSTGLVSKILSADKKEDD